MLDFGEIATPTGSSSWRTSLNPTMFSSCMLQTTTRQPLSRNTTRSLTVSASAARSTWTEEEGSAAEALLSARAISRMFPNFVLGRYFPDQLGVYLNVPIGPGRDGTEGGRSLHDRRAGACQPAEVEGLRSLWWDVHKEDHEMCRTPADLAAPRRWPKPAVCCRRVWEDSASAPSRNSSPPTWHRP